MPHHVARISAALFAGLCLAACGTSHPFYAPETNRGAPPVPRRLTAPQPSIGERATVAFAQLEGWGQDDHVAALRAFLNACAAARNADLAVACGRAEALGVADESRARRFFETNFRAVRVAEPGLLTAYFTPIYDARTKPDTVFRAPVRPMPADLSSRDWAGQSGAAYPDRAAIEERPAPDALAWMRPEDLFFMQIQGSGVLVFEDGARAKAVFAGTNGAPFVAVARPMIRQGLIAPERASGDGIRHWLADSRGEAADAVMRLDPRYVFFRLAPDDGQDPAGAGGAPLVPGRSAAVDLSQYSLGEPLWIDAVAPTLSGAFPTYRRLVVAMDAGGAIRGAARADLYLGRGASAGSQAGRVRHTLHLWRLVPVAPAGW
ncbi:MAG TPA: MltA domain-containing protein [Caulobacteraceae bacterium]